MNYAVELRYRVLLDIGLRVWARRPVEVGMGAVNVIWQRDASSMCLRALELASSPPRALNVTGPVTLHVRWIAERTARSSASNPWSKELKPARHYSVIPPWRAVFWDVLRAEHVKRVKRLVSVFPLRPTP